MKHACVCIFSLSSDWIGAGSSPRLLDWNSVQHKLPWNVVILLGSGFALAEAAQVYTNHTVTCTCTCTLSTISSFLLHHFILHLYYHVWT